MTVLQVCAYAAPYEGNFIKSLKALAIELKKRGHKQVYAFPETAKQIDWCKDLEKSAEVYYLPLAKARIRLKTYIAVKRILDQHPDVEVIHSHFELYDVPVSIVAPERIKVFWHLHDALEMYSDLRNRLVHKVQYGLLHKHAALLSVSHKHMQYVLKQGFPPQQAVYLPNGLDTERISPVNTPIEDRQYDFLIFGWEFERKGVDLCIEAIRQLGRKVKTAVVGSHDTAEIINRLYGDVPGISVIEPQKDINALYSDCRCFLHISRAEGLSYALLEAAYAGLPVICSDIKENLFASEFMTVKMVQSENAAMIAEAMARQLEHPAAEFDKVIQTRSIIEAKYSLHCWTEKMLEQYGV